MNAQMAIYEQALNDFANDDDFIHAVVSSTTAGHSGGHYALHIREDGTTALYWSEQHVRIDEGVLLTVPAFTDEEAEDLAMGVDMTLALEEIASAMHASLMEYFEPMR